MLDISVHVATTICKLLFFINKSGFTQQRLRLVATQQDAFLREQYTVDVSVYSTDMFVFVDETGAD